LHLGSAGNAFLLGGNCANERAQVGEILGEIARAHQRRQVAVHALDANLGKDCRQSGEDCGQNYPEEPGDVLNIGFGGLEPIGDAP
jgi:hypothetical protein